HYVRQCHLMPPATSWSCPLSLHDALPIFVLSLAVAANAQTFRGTINGTVTDPSGASVPNAAVKATEIATGIDHATTTTSEGAFADRKSTRLNSSHVSISYAVFCLKKKTDP